MDAGEEGVGVGPRGQLRQPGDVGADPEGAGLARGQHRRGDRVVGGDGVDVAAQVGQQRLVDDVAGAPRGVQQQDRDVAAVLARDRLGHAARSRTSAAPRVPPAQIATAA